MKDFLTFIFKGLADNPKTLKITKEKLDEEADLFRVKIDPSDMGRVIGKGGRVIKSIRQLARVKMATSEKKAVIQLAEPEEAGKEEKATG